VKNIKDKNQPSNRYNSKNVNEFNSTNCGCFGCGKQGHIKDECPSNVSKEKRGLQEVQEERQIKKSIQ